MQNYDAWGLKHTFNHKSLFLMIAVNQIILILYLAKVFGKNFYGWESVRDLGRKVRQYTKKRKKKCDFFVQSSFSNLGISNLTIW